VPVAYSSSTKANSSQGEGAKLRAAVLNPLRLPGCRRDATTAKCGDAKRWMLGETRTPFFFRRVMLMAIAGTPRFAGAELGSHRLTGNREAVLPTTYSRCRPTAAAQKRRIL